MGYRHPILEPGADARRDLLAAPVVLGAHLDTPESEVDDETLVGALSAFMDAHECYLASLGARHGIMLDSGCCPRTRATACASSCGASADGPTPDQASGGQTRGSSSRAGRTDTASPASAERPASTRCLRALVQRSGDGLGGRAWPPDGTSRPRTARRGVSIFYRRGGRAVGGPRAPAPRLDLGRST